MSKLIQTAELAGLFHLQGSDLVFNNDNDGHLIYYDCIVSSRWTDYGFISYMAVMDKQTNIVQIQKYKIPIDKLNSVGADFVRLPVSDLTVAALSLYVWQSTLKKRKVLLLVSDWLKTASADDASDPKAIFCADANDYEPIADPMDALYKIADRYHISFHIESIQLIDKLKTTTTTSSASSIMLRLMMCKDLLTTNVTQEQIKKFCDYVNPNDFLSKLVNACKFIGLLRQKVTSFSLAKGE